MRVPWGGGELARRSDAGSVSGLQHQQYPDASRGIFRSPLRLLLERIIAHALCAMTYSAKQKILTRLLRPGVRMRVCLAIL